MSKRADILRKAEECVCGQREQDYGSPEDNFQIIADLWTAYLREQIEPIDVANMMALLKIARIRSGSGTEDSFIDLAGYAACGGEIANNMKKDQDPCERYKHLYKNARIVKIPFDKSGNLHDAIEEIAKIIFKGEDDEED